MIHRTDCPVCHSVNIHPFLAAMDHTVSSREFEMYKCEACTVLFTQDAPNQEEIGPFYEATSYISHTDTREGLINRLYHIVRKYTLSSKKKLVEVETGLRGGKILDIGCGTGAFLNEMKNGGWQINGLEPDPGARAIASSLYNIHPAPSADLFQLPIDSYDVVSMWHVLEHVHQLQEYIEQIKKLLSAKGILFIAVPNYTSYDATLYSRYWAAYDVPRHLYHFSPVSMKKLMQAHGMQVIKMKPMWFDSFYVSMLSEQYKTGKGNIFRAFFTGLFSNLKAVGNPSKCSSVIYVISKKLA